MKNNQKASKDNAEAYLPTITNNNSRLDSKEENSICGLKVDEVFRNIQAWRRENRQKQA